MKNDKQVYFNMVIAVDFDGTCVEHKFPFIGKEIGAVPVLKKLVEKGHKIILLTMRSHKTEKTKNAQKYGMVSVENDTLDDAISWFKKNGIPLYGINENPTQKEWTESPKVFANLYIDDNNLGIPKKNGYVDWVECEKLLKQLKLL